MTSALACVARVYMVTMVVLLLLFFFQHLLDNLA